jgi:hypothetical protein
MTAPEVMSDKDQLIIDWVEKSPPYWADHIIKSWDWDRDNWNEITPFVTSHFWSDRHSLNVYSVIGTAHPDYAGLTWMQFLKSGKRMRGNQLLLQSNPDYYLETAVKHPSLLYVSLDGKDWYVNGDGNHRTCLARFQFERLNEQGDPSQTMLHGVWVDDYRVDWLLFDLYQRIGQILQSGKIKHAKRIECVSKHLSREDGPAWKIDIYLPQLKLINQDGSFVMLDHDATRIYLGQLERQLNGGFFLWWLAR